VTYWGGVRRRRLRLFLLQGVLPPREGEAKARGFTLLKICLREISPFLYGDLLESVELLEAYLIEHSLVMYKLLQMYCDKWIPLAFRKR
jgi:hypothetical protein